MPDQSTVIVVPEHLRFPPHPVRHGPPTALRHRGLRQGQQPAGDNRWDGGREGGERGEGEREGGGWGGALTSASLPHQLPSGLLILCSHLPPPCRKRPVIIRSAFSRLFSPHSVGFGFSGEFDLGYQGSLTASYFFLFNLHLFPPRHHLHHHLGSLHFLGLLTFL